MKKQRFWIVGLVLFCSILLFSIPASGLNGPAVSQASNPVFSFGGNSYLSGSEITESFSSSAATMDMRITDIHLSVCCDNYVYGAYVKLSTSSGTDLGQWSLNRNTPIVASMVSGLTVPAGEDLVLTANRNSNGVNLYYTISGQYVRP